MSIMGNDLFGEPIAPAPQGSKLAERWEYPPFSVLNAREGWWQERKRSWLALGIKSEVGRGGQLIENGGGMGSKGRYDAARTFGQDLMRGEHVVPNDAKIQLAPGGYSGSEKSAWLVEAPAVEGEAATGTSIFDPVITELAYRWFCPPAGHVLDPFAGGSVRGIVASILGFEYTGFELRPEQVAANGQQAIGICQNVWMPRWITGDSAVNVAAWDCTADFMFSCPPYGDLEVYSDDPADISGMAHEQFLEAYRTIIAHSCAKLKEDRFACFVVGDFRCKRGFYRNFPGETVAAFEAAGLKLYNEAILITAVGSLPVRAQRQFRAGRKLGKSHQNMLVFVKGCPRLAAAACNGQGELFNG
jgi:hypothetical protein